MLRGRMTGTLRAITLTMQPIASIVTTEAIGDYMPASATAFVSFGGLNETSKTFNGRGCEARARKFIAQHNATIVAHAVYVSHACAAFGSYCQEGN